jgi:hypothetical protein
MDTADKRFVGDEVHSVTLNSCGEVGRHAIEYDMAVAAYGALQDQPQKLVIEVRRGRGYEVDAFSRLESHPALSSEDDQAVRAHARLERHLADYRSYSAADLRRHLTATTGEHTHGRKPSEVRRLSQPELVPCTRLATSTRWR